MKISIYITNFLRHVPIIHLLVDIGINGILKSLPKWCIMLFLIFAPLYLTLFLQIIFEDETRVSFYNVLTPNELLPLGLSFIAPAIYWTLINKPFETEFSRGFARSATKFILLISFLIVFLIVAVTFSRIKVSPTSEFLTTISWFLLSYCVFIWAITTAYDDYVLDPRIALENFKNAEDKNIDALIDAIENEGD